MDANLERTYSKLVANLEDLTKLYRALLDLVRKDKEFLVAAKRDELEQNNQAKEALVSKLRMTDVLRSKYATELATLVGADVESPRLLEIAQKMGGAEGDRLRSIHSALDLLIKRISEINRENDEFAQSALKTLNGALNNIKDTVSGKKTYERKGQMKSGPQQAGNFVRKEV